MFMIELGGGNADDKGDVPLRDSEKRLYPTHYGAIKERVGGGEKPWAPYHFWYCTACKRSGTFFGEPTGEASLSTALLRAAYAHVVDSFDCAADTGGTSLIASNMVLPPPIPEPEPKVEVQVIQDETLIDLSPFVTKEWLSENLDRLIKGPVATDTPPEPEDAVDALLESLGLDASELRPIDDPEAVGGCATVVSGIAGDGTVTQIDMIHSLTISHDDLDMAVATLDNKIKIISWLMVLLFLTMVMAALVFAMVIESGRKAEASTDKALESLSDGG